MNSKNVKSSSGVRALFPIDCEENAGPTRTGGRRRKLPQNDEIEEKVLPKYEEDPHSNAMTIACMSPSYPILPLI